MTLKFLRREVHCLNRFPKPLLYSEFIFSFHNRFNDSRQMSSHAQVGARKQDVHGVDKNRRQLTVD